VHRCCSPLSLPGFSDAHRKAHDEMPRMTAHIALASMASATRDRGTVALQPSGARVDYPITPRIWEALRTALSTLAKIDLASGAEVVRTGHDPSLEIRSQADLAKIASAAYDVGRLAVFSAHVMAAARWATIRSAPWCARRPAPPHRREPARDRRLGPAHRPRRQPARDDLRPGPPHRDPPPLVVALTLTASWATRRCATCRRCWRIDTTNHRATRRPPPSTSRRCSATRRSSRPARPSEERKSVVARVTGNGKKPPLLLHGHLDVVTADPASWTHPPFAGEIHDGYLWAAARST